MTTSAFVSLGDPIIDEKDQAPPFFTCWAGGGAVPKLPPGRELACPHRRRRKIGFYQRRHDQAKVQRYLCLICRKSFSTATGTPLYRAKKPWLMGAVYSLFGANASLRRSALMTGVTRESVTRYFILLAGRCKAELERDVAAQRGAITAAQFDDLETHEHTKMKPLSVTLAVQAGTRKILGLSVASMPAKGLLARKSRAKYGVRVDQRRRGLNDVLAGLQFLGRPEGFTLTSDQCPRYPALVAKLLPKAKHIRVKGRRGCVTGQGELKRGGFDPLFSLNHTCAMLRAGVSRLIRRTWNTTKKAERFFCHLLIYAHFHNFVLLKKPAASY